MKYRRLGRTDIEVSVICQGGWSLVGGRDWGEQDRSDSVAAIRASLEAGVNFFDSAEVYGRGESESLFARALADRRKDVVIATKVSPENLPPKALREHCERSLRRLKTNYIDLYQIHWPNPDVPVAETLEVLAELKRAGKIRAVGVSNFGAGPLRELLAPGRVETNQLPYSLLWRPIEHEIQPLCVAADLSILCYSPLMQGLLTGKFASPDDVPAGRARTRLFSGKRPHARHGEAGCETEVFEAIAEVRRICESIGIPMGQAALAWLLARPGVASVVVGSRNAAQAAQNALAGDLELSGETVQQLSAATVKVKEAMGVNADMWETPSRMERPAPAADGQSP